jgi:predicted amidohydrolase
MSGSDRTAPRWQDGVVISMPDRTLRVASIQARAQPGDVAHNASTVARLMGETAGDGVRLAVFPELFLTAYHPPALAADPTRCDVAADGQDVVADPRLDPIRTAAVQSGQVAVVGASVSRAGGVRRCSVLLVEPSGQIRAVYDKQNLHGSHEKALFSPGERGCAIRVDSWVLGLGICYDGCFPEHGRAAALAGAHGYLCPSGYVTGSQHRRDVYYAARALDNTMYVVFANSVGGVTPWQLCGGAAVYDPQGQPVTRAGDHDEAVVVADLDPGELARVRATHTMLRDVAAYRADPGGAPRMIVC